MEKEYLLKLKEKISNLTQEELNQRDLYLKELSNGKIQGAKVGYPSIDKPWLKYYDKLNSTINQNKTVYQCLISNNKGYESKLAIEYFGAKISFGDLFANIEKTAKALECNGVKKGDFVTICAPGMPETVYSFYALSKLGAVSNMIANHFSGYDFIARIADCNSKLLIVMDSFYEEIKDAVKKSNIEKIVIVPTLNSSPLGIFSKKIKIDSRNNEILWNQFLKEGRTLEKSSNVEYEKNLPVTMVYSSGTTGASKGILLSNDSFQNSINSYFESGLDISRGQKFYQIIPTWYSTGISTSVHLPLSCGASIYMDPRFERKIFAKNIIKAKPNYSVAPTSMYEGLLDDNVLKNKDISYFKNAFEGGEPLSIDLALRINKVFKEHGNDVGIKVGYGQCECGATITTQTDRTEKYNGSVGIPLPKINIQICDNNFNEVPFNQRGQIIVNTPCSMLGYYKNEKASEEYFFIDENGCKWNCTGDIGYMNDNGDLFIEGRTSDYSIINDEVIYNFDIEKIVNNIKGVKLCDVLNKVNENNNQSLVLHLILEEENTDIENLIHNIQNEILEKTDNINMVPNFFKIWNEFPHAKSGKRDTQKMKNETSNLMCFELEKQKILKK